MHSAQLITQAYGLRDYIAPHLKSASEFNIYFLNALLVHLYMFMIKTFLYSGMIDYTVYVAQLILILLWNQHVTMEKANLFFLDICSKTNDLNIINMSLCKIYALFFDKSTGKGEKKEKNIKIIVDN